MPPRRRRSGLAGLVLTPGAGANRDQPSLVAIEKALPIPVRRVDFPYRLAGRRAPDRPPVLVGTVVDAAKALADELDAPLDAIGVGGRSMGGRMASMAIAEGLGAGGLVCVSYPLHPPGRPERLRVEHLGELRLPCLFVSGSRDAFGTPDELAAAVATIPGPAQLVVLDGGDHGLRGRDEEVAGIVADWIGRL